MSQDSKRKVPYLLHKNPSEFSAEDKIKEEDWLKKREDKRKAYSPSSWKSYFMKGYQVPIRDGDNLGLWTSNSLSNVGSNLVPTNNTPYVLMLHGGGYSGLTWGPVVDELSLLIMAEYGALDLRGHGESECADESNLSLERLTDDVLDAIEWIKKKPINLGTRPLILMGHSMGGALGVNVALKLQESSNVNLSGLIVLDVVEGSAMQALTSMQFVLKGRPQEFKSLSEGIHWCIRSGQTKNLDSARISMLGQLKAVNGDENGVVKVQNDTPTDTTQISRKKLWDSVETENGHIDTESQLLPSSKKNTYTWRIDLTKTEPYWRGWFEGLSKKFLNVKCPKLLMLAGVDRLDKELTVGQMQGKFQMQVFHQVGHAVHEDAPEKAAEVIASYLNRQKLVNTKTSLTPTLPGC